MKDTRIQKAIADAGYTSRRKAEELIAAGKVKVNGRPAEIGMKVDVKHDLRRAWQKNRNGFGYGYSRKSLPHRQT